MMTNNVIDIELILLDLRQKAFTEKRRKLGDFIGVILKKRSDISIIIELIEGISGTLSCCRNVISEFAFSVDRSFRLQRITKDRLMQRQENLWHCRCYREI